MSRNWTLIVMIVGVAGGLLVTILLIVVVKYCLKMKNRQRETSYKHLLLGSGEAGAIVPTRPSADRLTVRCDRKEIEAYNEIDEAFAEYKHLLLEKDDKSIYDESKAGIEIPNPDIVSEDSAIYSNGYKSPSATDLRMDGRDESKTIEDIIDQKRTTDLSTSGSRQRETPSTKKPAECDDEIVTSLKRPKATRRQSLDANRPSPRRQRDVEIRRNVEPRLHNHNNRVERVRGENRLPSEEGRCSKQDTAAEAKENPQLRKTQYRERMQMTVRSLEDDQYIRQTRRKREHFATGERLKFRSEDFDAIFEDEAELGLTKDRRKFSTRDQSTLKASNVSTEDASDEDTREDSSAARRYSKTSCCVDDRLYFSSTRYDEKDQKYRSNSLTTETLKLNNGNTAGGKIMSERERRKSVERCRVELGSRRRESYDRPKPLRKHRSLDVPDEITSSRSTLLSRETREMKKEKSTDWTLR